MRDFFYDLADHLDGLLQPGETYTCTLEAEESDFARLSRNRVRQAGSVRQCTVSVDLIADRRHAQGSLVLAGDPGADHPRLAGLVQELRKRRTAVQADPYLYYATDARRGDDADPGTLPESGEALRQIRLAAEGLDLVGLWACGIQYAGFASSHGSRLWHSRGSFNLDWSCYHQGDKAVKSTYAGKIWDPAALAERMAGVRQSLEIMARAPHTVDPGRYRAYLAPSALKEILDMLAWGGFSLKSHRTRQTPLLKMIEEGRRLHPAVSLAQDRTAGLAPGFTPEGFARPARVELVADGSYRGCLVAARSAREYGEPVNAPDEAPDALDMAPGEMAESEALSRLDTGVYLNNLWYCNYSDRNDCRITGMTRFACFWVEGGRIRAPLSVMRFDDSVYRMLGESLEGLTRERALILDPDTYHQRSWASARLPGALVRDLSFTL